MKTSDRRRRLVCERSSKSFSGDSGNVSPPGSSQILLESSFPDLGLRGLTVDFEKTTVF